MDSSIAPSSNFSASSSSSSSAIFRPRKSDDWNEYRTVIENLYRDNQLKLRDVKRIMERDYNFVASEKQYKDRLAAWHIRKNIKAKEVHVMIRKQQKRAARGKQTAFRVGGQEVDSKRIARFVRRYGASWDNTRNDTHQASPEPDESKYEPLRSPDIDDSRSLSLATLSPTSTHDTPKPMDESLPSEDPWQALDSFQDRLMALEKTLEATMSGFITPGEEC
ncbi:Clr5 domain-containing protein [Aspergillus clavatus NRRL 1]|uniref:Clr5 domain-containing protein n=1 Tax=Aspergillus clavatus (strain ATCC 1007 / CBS 513.65 / DSM 816 / NCTC 3887 / NRRL 1 / QM 1276 / 107) TaxID=344612 RepID=A1C457_ASPCL|nr:uncharacterized protein ACLA_058590 [Aspergillus clavatus NRRL 1]EAW15197.1 hypothetical protein ACLA_058590 [Aspergillus clavatus NRRL 1]